MYKFKNRTLYKAGWVKVTDEEKCVIDSNDLVADRIEEWENIRRANVAAALAEFGEEGEEGEPEFVSGIEGEQIDALFSDGEGSGNVIKAVEAGPNLEEIEAQAQAMLDEAQ